MPEDQTRRITQRSSTAMKWLRAALVVPVVMVPWLLLIPSVWGLAAALAANLVVVWAGMSTYLDGRHDGREQPTGDAS